VVELEDNSKGKRKKSLWVVDKIDLMTPIDTTICVLIILSVTALALWILARFIPRIKTLSLSSFIAFIVVVTCLVCWCLE
jgi:Na+-translocating ferredoxin:NAD+ oxidoreductase RnfA subunit